MIQTWYTSFECVLAGILTGGCPSCHKIKMEINILRFVQL